MIKKAIAFANVAHSKHTRKDTDIPYILHPLEAGILVSQMKYDENLICGAILHDTAEDAKVSYESIKEIFNERVMELVKVQSEDKSKTWEERKMQTVENLKKEEDEDIKIVSLGDKLSNMRAIYRDYKLIGDDLWKRFNVSEKDKQGWYYKGLVEGLASLNKYTEYQEFKKLVFEIFG